MSTVYFVAGASRGIGLETVRQLALNPEARVVAAARDPSASKALQEIVKASEGRVETVVLDVNSEEIIAAAVKATREIAFVKANAGSIDVLLLVAGVSSARRKEVLETTAAVMIADANANYIGAVLTTIAFVPLLQSSPKKDAAKILLVSSGLGSAGMLPHLGPMKTVGASYSASKAAANMWFRKLAIELEDGSGGAPRDGGWAVGLIHPGIVITDMNPQGQIEVDESAAGVLKVLETQLKAETTGSFWDEKGEPMAF